MGCSGVSSCAGPAGGAGRGWGAKGGGAGALGGGHGGQAGIWGVGWEALLEQTVPTEVGAEQSSAVVRPSAPLHRTSRTRLPKGGPRDQDEDF